MFWTSVVLVSLLSVNLGAAWAMDPSAVLSDLHMANQHEIDMGKMAQEKSQSEDVKAYGAQLVLDHQAADDKVLSLAKKDSIALLSAEARGLLAKHEKAQAHQMMAELSGKSGAEFDKAFTKAMIKDHKKDIAKLERAEKSLTHAETKELVSKVLPTLRQHLATAQKLVDKNG